MSAIEKATQQYSDDCKTFADLFERGVISRDEYNNLSFKASEQLVAVQWQCNYSPTCHALFDNPSEFLMSIDYGDDCYRVTMTYADGYPTLYKLKETPVIAHLLSALRAAIVAAPAKA